VSPFRSVGVLLVRLYRCCVGGGEVVVEEEQEVSCRVLDPCLMCAWLIVNEVVG